MFFREVKNIWFTLFDFKNNKLIKSCLLNFCCHEFTEIKSKNHIKLCSNTNIEYTKTQISKKKYKISFHQNF